MGARAIDAGADRSDDAFALYAGQKTRLDPGFHELDAEKSVTDVSV